MKILLIEDDDPIANYLVRGLREEGMVVERVADGESGWHALRSGKWDAVLLDRTLPGSDGVELLRRLRRGDRATYVLFVTARDAVEDRVTGLDAGADDYLCKPFAFSELLARLRAVERRRALTSEPVVGVGDVSVNLATHRAERAGRPLALTSKEEALLVFFLRHPREILSRTRLYEAVWDERFDGMSNTLEVHVMEVRKKLEEHGPRVLHTMRGRGHVYGDAADLGLS